ncbi:ArsR family transcriptional regulator [Halobaculum magnesiiphilum]|uniref:ArsR family transcriptional regulator n=1 Tax=Halobaculum magnesiiphilum TaxID=1017351 RepID=A0A8T8WGL2_9EURY|nr:ArsR family transcriptional regulator [Halobaculum magnesiiphilum]QZP38978.1 ArsR family transcriptional regulator [Halobaculum magnesiiphilum]
MRRSATWMTLWDDRLLEIIRNEGSGSPTELSESDYIRVSPQHVSRRLSTLADHGLLTHLGNGVYVITEEGNRYLDGDLDAEELSDSGEENGTAAA